MLSNLDNTPEPNRKLVYDSTPGIKGRDSDKEPSFRDYLDVQNGPGTETKLN